MKELEVSVRDQLTKAIKAKWPKAKIKEYGGITAIGFEATLPDGSVVDIRISDKSSFLGLF